MKLVGVLAECRVVLFHEVPAHLILGQIMVGATRLDLLGSLIGGCVGLRCLIILAVEVAVGSSHFDG